MFLILIALEYFKLIPYQKDGKWGIADINGNVVVEPKYDGVGISHGYEAQTVSIQIVRKSQENTSIRGVVKLRYDPSTSAWTYYDTLQALKLGWSFISSFAESYGVDKILREITMKIMNLMNIPKAEYLVQLLVPVPDYAKPVIEGPIWVLKDDKFGLVDISEREIVPPKYDEVFPFEKGRAWVKLNGKYGMIDKNGKEIIPIKYDAAVVSDDGIIWVKIDDKWGIMDTSGKEISPPVYDYEAVTPFTNGVAWILKNNKWGLVDGSGKTVIPPKFDGACPFVGEFSAVMIENKWGLIDKTGKEIIPYVIENTPCDDLEDLLREGLIAVKTDGKFGFVDKNGKVVIPPRYEKVMPFIRGISAVKRDGKWGFADKTGKEIVPPTYDEFEGYCYVEEMEGGISYSCCSDCYYNYLKKGYFPVLRKEVRDRVYKYSAPFVGEYDFLAQIDSNLFLAEKDRKWGLIDKNNKEVEPFKYDYLLHLRKNLFEFYLNEKHGVISIGRGIIIQPKYDDVFYAGDDMIGVILNNKIGFADTTGKIVIPPKYDTTIIPFFSNGFTIVKLKRKLYAINKDGKEVELKYDGLVLHLGKGLFIHLPEPKELEELDKIINTSKDIYRVMEVLGVREEEVLNKLRESFPEIKELKKVKKLEDAVKLLKEKAWQERGREIMKKVFYFRVLPDGSILEFRVRG
jgi:hypothetical protein